ncbi:hypothetical protein BpHYR1_029603 [Brachionus plicatilis]|uniref:Uncharacterized protein n=1 Tax=Brachionus plicatilis TaxID=10195 RepID=A0A3M7RQ54_BRAPC|nr:hypothetical protein BpHYR1_029603 [Brachionus plicatilis]
MALIYRLKAKYLFYDKRPKHRLKILNLNCLKNNSFILFANQNRFPTSFLCQFKKAIRLENLPSSMNNNIGKWISGFIFKVFKSSTTYFTQKTYWGQERDCRKQK